MNTAHKLGSTGQDLDVLIPELHELKMFYGGRFFNLKIQPGQWLFNLILSNEIRICKIVQAI